MKANHVPPIWDIFGRMDSSSSSSSSSRKAKKMTNVVSAMCNAFSFFSF
jgi:hypothetical protein